MLKGKKIIIGITGSIAVYKIATLTRLLIKAGADVQIIMTKAATAFVSPLTLATLSKRPVLTEIIDEDSWNSHVDLGLWADYFIIAPATAATMSRMANGLSDNLLIAVYLSARCPVAVAPAMDLDMWMHHTTKRNIEILKKDGISIISVGTGELASGLIGAGRMAEPEEIFSFLENEFHSIHDFKDKNVIITAGPTKEALDPVRFLSNHSSGKMGISIATEFANRGAIVHLILGPVNILPPTNVVVHNVTTAEEMYQKSIELFTKADIAILSAAVADYKPKEISNKKIKKSDDNLSIELERTKDIAANLGQHKNKQILIGFALETHNEEENAKKKLVKKNFDFIVLNSMNDKGATFGFDTNKIQIIDKYNKIKKFQLKSKEDVAKDIVDYTLNFI